LVFGGINKNNEPQNSLKLLQVSRKNPEWIDPVTHGKPPEPRHSCSLNIYDRLDIVVIYGGRNNHRIFKDVFIIDLYKFEWIRVPVRDMSNRERYGHSAVTYEDHLVVFGGMDDKYIGSDLYLMDLCSFDNIKSFWYTDIRRSLLIKK
jgi:hypothetical protein